MAHPVAVGHNRILERKAPDMKTSLRTAAATPPKGSARHRELEQMLQDHRREMQHELKRRVHHEPSVRRREGLDEIELAEVDIQEHIEVAVMGMKSEGLERVREALVRLEAGHYGFCDECEREISENRLRALPFAVRCTTCEALHERRRTGERWQGSRLGTSLFLPGQAGS
jgi:DnaK suppressor protein